MKTYAVKSIFGPTVQGEGSLTGAVVCFLRFAGCNIWDGRPESRAASACPYCDTDFLGGDKVTAVDIVARLHALLPHGGLVVVSGGEPLLQLDAALAASLRAGGFKVAIETNGTRALGVDLIPMVDHVSCSPKVEPAAMKLEWCDDLKVLWPHPNPRITPDAFAGFPTREARFIQPVNHDHELNQASIASALEECYRQARAGHAWRLSLQMHKAIGVE